MLGTICLIMPAKIYLIESVTCFIDSLQHGSDCFYTACGEEIAIIFTMSLIVRNVASSYCDYNHCSNVTVINDAIINASAHSIRLLRMSCLFMRFTMLLTLCFVLL